MVWTPVHAPIANGVAVAHVAPGVWATTLILIAKKDNEEKTMVGIIDFIRN
jgi:hypothetical protein